MDTMLDLNDIVVFARVIEAGSFTAAARLLGMPKTTVSRRIAALEREVGVTDAGRLYYEESSQALRTIEDANLRLAEARAETSGTIRISAPVGFSGYFLSSAIFDFLATYPKTKVELRLRPAQSGRKRYRPLNPHRNPSRLHADRPQARLYA